MSLTGSRYGKPAELEWAAVDSNHLPPRYRMAERCADPAAKMSSISAALPAPRRCSSGGVAIDQMPMTEPAPVVVTALIGRPAALATKYWTAPEPASSAGDANVRPTHAQSRSNALETRSATTCRSIAWSTCVTS